MGSYFRKDIFDKTVVNEIKMLSEDYLSLTKLDSICNNRTLICERLWKVFQINGYIGFEIDFPSHLFKFRNSSILAKAFIATAINAHINGKLSHGIWKKQRRESLVNAYRAISMESLKAIIEMYNKDFELFDYDKHPTAIFGTSEYGDKM